MKELLLLLSLIVCGVVAQQPPRPPLRPPAADLQERLEDLSGKIKKQRAVNVSAQRAIQYAQRYLRSAKAAFHEGKPAQAYRLAAASDALIRVAEHQRHLMSGGGPHGPPPPQMVEDHLRRVYFRTQQADYFLAQSHDSTVAAQLPEWGRGFYVLAVRAYDRKDWIAADENAKCADEVVSALENLAQAASVNAAVPAVPSPPRPPKPPSL